MHYSARSPPALRTAGAAAAAQDGTAHRPSAPSTSTAVNRRKTPASPPPVSTAATATPAAARLSIGEPRATRLNATTATAEEQPAEWVRPWPERPITRATEVPKYYRRALPHPLTDAIVGEAAVVTTHWDIERRRHTALRNRQALYRWTARRASNLPASIDGRPVAAPSPVPAPPPHRQGPPANAPHPADARDPADAPALLAVEPSAPVPPPPSQPAAAIAAIEDDLIDFGVDDEPMVEDALVTAAADLNIFGPPPSANPAAASLECLGWDDVAHLAHRE